MSNIPISAYQDLANSDAKVIKSLHAEFEHIMGAKMDEKLFIPLYIHARYLPEFCTIPISLYRPFYLESKGRFPLAANFLCKQFSRTVVDNQTIPTPSKQIADKISEQGYTVVENFLSATQVEKIKKELSRYEYYTPVTDHKPYDLNKIRQEESDPSKASTYYTDCTGNDIPGDSEIGRLVADRFLADVASSYFQTHAYLTQAVGFYTKAKDPKLFTAGEVHGSAQKWHFDYGDLRFIKCFIYLTDVAPENGPHCLVANTHEDRLVFPDREEDFEKAGYRVYDSGIKEGLIKDEWVTKTFDSKRVKELCAPKGTLIVENTAGLHRGGYCYSGIREVLAFTFAISNIQHPPFQPTIDYVPPAPRHSHLTNLLKCFKQEQLDRAEAFRKKPSVMSRIQNRIKTMSGAV